MKNLQASPPAASSQKGPAWLYKRVGRFQLQAILGEGAAGKVFRAEDLQLGRHVALKIISLTDNSGNRRRAAERVVEEARLAAGLDHPNIVRILEVNETPRFFFIAMELVEGGNLNELVGSSGPMDCVRACQLAAEAADALAYAHQQGVIHRDVKPANLMLSRDGRCKLADFGLAVLRNSGVSEATQGPAGTPMYVAPELIAGQEAGPAADIYSLGGTLCYLLTGKPPFVAETAAEMFEKHLHEPPPDLAALRPDVPESLAGAIQKALQKSPQDRFADAADFARVLRIHTIPVGLVAAYGAGRPPVRTILLWGGLAAILGTAVISGLVFWLAGGWGMFFGRTSTFGPLPSPPAPETATPSAENPTTASPATEVLQATDSAQLWAIAQDPGQAEREVTVEGVVDTAQYSKNLKFFEISFKGVGADGFCCSYNPEVFRPQLIKPGTASDLDLAEKRIRVLGRIQVTNHRPVIHILGADQLQVLPATPEHPTISAANEIFQASDTKRLLSIARGADAEGAKRELAVEGIVEAVQISKHAKFYRISFAGAGEDGFSCIYNPTVLPLLQQKLGSGEGLGLIARRVRVTGRVELNKDRPAIRIESPDQIKILPAATTQSATESASTQP